MTLASFFKQNPRAALAFSGGTDSSYLLYEARKNGCDVQAFFVKTAFQPQFELDDALRLAKDVGAPVEVLEFDILGRKDVAQNPQNRCYYCKHALFGLLRQEAAKRGFEVLMDGTNASDDAGDRPGMKALTELRVLSPLRECGLTKDEIRLHSREAGLFTWNKPAYACLATRIPCGTPITAEALRRADQSEEFLRSLGFSDLRVRVLGSTAKIQLPQEQLTSAAQRADEIYKGLSPYFSNVLLDLNPRL